MPPPWPTLPSATTPPAPPSPGGPANDPAKLPLLPDLHRHGLAASPRRPHGHLAPDGRPHRELPALRSHPRRPVRRGAARRLGRRRRRRTRRPESPPGRAAGQPRRVLGQVRGASRGDRDRHGVSHPPSFDVRRSPADGGGPMTRITLAQVGPTTDAVRGSLLGPDQAG